MILDSVDHHLPLAGSIERAAVVPGQFLAWCANMQLLDPQFEEEHAQAVLRVRFREIAPAEFFIVTSGGEFSDRCLSERGRAFARATYPEYTGALPDLLAGDVYSTEAPWNVYEQVSAFLTRRLMGAETKESPWWQFWKR